MMKKMIQLYTDMWNMNQSNYNYVYSTVTGSSFDGYHLVK